MTPRAAVGLRIWPTWPGTLTRLIWRSAAADVMLAAGLSCATGLVCCVTVVIVDETLAPRALKRMDGADMVTAGLATGKARLAAANGAPTAVWRGLASAGRFLEATIPVALDRLLDGAVLFAGGYPLRAGGWTLGGVGVSGGDEEQDDTIAREVLGALPQLEQFTAAHGHG
jgi:uncharacterized protein GlcG (DUF336 family)